MRKTLLLLLTLVYAGSAFGSVVIVRIWPDGLYGMTQERSIHWLLNDYICARHVVEPDRRQTERHLIACGQVVRVTKRGLIVNITGSSETLKIGEQLEVEKVSIETYRQSGFMEIEYLDPRDPFDQRNISLGANFFQPNILFEQGITRKLSLAFLFTYLSTDVGIGKIQGATYSLGVNYYSRRLFDGFWAMMGGGWYLFYAKNQFEQERKASFTPFAVVGWRFLLPSDWNFGVAGGAQYFMTHTPQTFDLQWSGLLPFVMLQLGYKF